jgi:zinc protease
MKSARILLCLWLLATLGAVGARAAETTGGPGAAPDPRGADPLDLRAEKYELPNGLDVILYEDHRLPMVAVNVWYHVGSKNEDPGRTGFAHFFEHMMFQGSEHHDTDYFMPLEKVGAFVNGSTTEDRTNYLEDVPSNYLETALWLEADRMGFLLPSMTENKVINQRSVVMNEHREDFENAPYGMDSEWLAELMYPPEHPYSHTVLGRMDDLAKATLDEVQAFFRRYYAPGNASLCITGDFSTAEAKALVEKYFAPLPPGESVDRLVSWTPQLSGVKRMVAEDDVALPRLYMEWHTPAMLTEGDMALDFVSRILTDGKTSRLYKELVYDRQIAQNVVAYQYGRELSGIFHIEVTAKPGHDLAEIEAATDAVLRKLLAEGVRADEVERARTSLTADFVRDLQEIGSFGGLADTFNFYNTYLGDPNRIAWHKQQYDAITREMVIAAARRYIDLDRRGILSIVPRGERSASDDPADRAVQPTPGGEPAFTPPRIQRATLPSGLTLMLIEDHRLPLVQVNLVVKSGWAADPPERLGAASMTAQLIDEGTASRSALQISDALLGMGARMNTYGMFDGSGVNLDLLRGKLDAGLELLADVVQHPSFPEEELERLRQRNLARIQQEAREPYALALKAAQRVLFGPRHPYGQPFSGTGTEASLRAMTREDLVAYHATYYRPNNATIVFAGDVTLADAIAKTEQAFHAWRPQPVSPPAIEALRPPTACAIHIVDRPGSAQSVVMVFEEAPPRSAPDYFDFLTVNTILGGTFISRLNMNLREDKGYTYGCYAEWTTLRYAGAFAATAQVQTEVTQDAVRQIVGEIRDIAGTRPPTATELDDARNTLAQGFPQRFQTLAGVAGQAGELVTYDLPDDDWQSYVARARAVDAAAALRAAQAHIHPERLQIVVVGDRAKIEPGLRELGLGEIVAIDAGTL